MHVDNKCGHVCVVWTYCSIRFGCIMGQNISIYCGYPCTVRYAVIKILEFVIFDLWRDVFGYS